jgi:hypothetical protein
VALVGLGIYWCCRRAATGSCELWSCELCSSVEHFPGEASTRVPVWCRAMAASEHTVFNRLLVGVACFLAALLLAWDLKVRPSPLAPRPLPLCGRNVRVAVRVRVVACAIARSFSAPGDAAPQVIDFSRADVSNSGLAGALTAMQQLAEDTLAAPADAYDTEEEGGGAETLTPRQGNRRHARSRRRGAALQRDDLHDMVLQAVKDAVQEAVSKHDGVSRNPHMSQPLLA